MADLRALCEAAGFPNVKTYIASGNVVLKSRKSAASIKAALEAKLKAYAGKLVPVLVRTVDEMEQVRAANPFPDAAPNRTLVTFLDGPPASDALEAITGRKDEKIELGAREIYVLYGDGMGQSKLKVPAAKTGTARNMNTVAKLIELAAAL